MATVVAAGKRPAAPINMNSSASFVEDGVDRWESIRAKLQAIKVGTADVGGIAAADAAAAEPHASPRSLSEQLWQEKQRAMIAEAVALQEALALKIAEAADAGQHESNALHLAQLRVNTLTARRDALRLDLADADATASAIRDEIARARDRVAQLEAATLRLRHEREQEVQDLKYRISMYAKCTGVTWEAIDQPEVLKGIVDIPSLMFYRPFTLDTTGMTSVEKSQAFWNFVDESHALAFAERDDDSSAFAAEDREDDGEEVEAEEEESD